MDRIKEIRHVDFDVYLAGTQCDPNTGLVTDAVYVKTVKIPVYGEYDFLTPEAHLIIDEVKIRAYFKRLPDYSDFMNTPNSSLGGICPEEALLTHEGQRDLFALLYTLKLIK